MIDWSALTISEADYELIAAIATRAKLEGDKRPKIQILMDLEVVHGGTCPLRLAELANAKRYDFAHDIAGIRRHLNRETGKLEDCFLPRFAKGERDEK